MQELYYLLILIVTLINAAAFVLVGLDKRKSARGSERFPEVYFFLLATIFGSLGIFLGMFFFRHKTHKIYFLLGIGLLLIQQTVLLMLLYKLYLI